MDSLKEKREGEWAYGSESILAELNIFFFAGVDTTSSYLTMTLYLLCQHPEVEEKVREEINTYMKDKEFSY